MSEKESGNGLTRVLGLQSGKFRQGLSQQIYEVNQIRKDQQYENQDEGYKGFKSVDGKFSDDLIKNESIAEQFENIEQKYISGQYKQYLSEKNILNGKQINKEPFVIESGRKSSFQEKININFVQFKYQIQKINQQAFTIIRQMNNETKEMSQLFKTYKIVVNEFIQNRYPQQKVQRKSKKNSQQSVSFQNLQILQLKKQLINLGQQYTNAQIIIKQLQRTIMIKQNQNENLQQSIFDYQQQKAQLDLQIQNRINKALAQNKKDDEKQYYLKQINFLQQEIQNLSQKCLRINQKKQIALQRQINIKQRQQQLLIKQRQIQEQSFQLQVKQRQILSNMEKLKTKQNQLIKLQRNLYKRMQQLDARQNQIVSARNFNHRVVQSQANYKPQKILDQNKQSDFQLQGRCFENSNVKQIKTNYAYSRPISNVTSKKNQPLYSKVSRDDAFSNGSHSKDKIIKNKFLGNSNAKFQRPLTVQSGSKLSNLGSKLQQLRNQIKKQIQAVK